MNICMKCIRVYGSKSYYGRSVRQTTKESPVVLNSYPQNAEVSRIFFGSLADELAQAFSIQRAFGNAALSSYFGGKRSNLRDADKEIIQLSSEKCRFKVENWNYFITISVERQVELDESDVSSSEVIWIDIEKAQKLEDEFFTYARPFLERLASQVSLGLSIEFFRTVVKEGVFFFSESRVPFGLPRYSTGGTTVGLSHGEEEIDLLSINNRLNAFMKLTRTELDALDKSYFWYLQSLRESDTWKAYVAAFLAIEILTHKLGKRHYEGIVNSMSSMSNRPDINESRCDAIRGIIPPLKHLPLAGKFAIVAMALVPESADDDLATFMRLKESRDKIAHGSAADTDSLPLSEAQALLFKYLKAANSDNGNRLSIEKGDLDKNK